MEALKSFQNLSNFEKMLLFQRFFNRDESDIEEKAPDNSEKSSFSLFLESFKDAYYKDIPEDKIKEEISKGKQRTLDNWLIKRGNVTLPKSQVGESSRQNMTQSCETSHTCNKSVVTSHTEPIVQINDMDIDSVDVSRKRNSSESRIFSKKSDMNKNVSEEKESIISSKTTEKSKMPNEKYNLRPKRKVSEHPTVSKDDKSGIKHLKLSDIQKEYPFITDCDMSVQVNNFNDSSCRLSAKENDKCNKSGSVEKYNRRTKKKNLELPQPVKINNIADQSESTSQITQALTNSSESSITSPSLSNYQAFCLLLRKCREIGINVMDVLKNKNIQTLLNDHKNVNGDAVVFIGSFATKTGDTLPIVHFAESKTVLLKKLNELKR